MVEPQFLNNSKTLYDYYYLNDLLFEQFLLL